jgi:glycosyltransferase involved in cell wall biosynthesis
VTNRVSVSVVVPCFDEADSLDALVEGVRKHLGQTSYELILVDDGSTDLTAKRIARPPRKILVCDPSI